MSIPPIVALSGAMKSDQLLRREIREVEFAHPVNVAVFGPG